jgi:outer membrane scaffolding protein for murein synthesis (MipA/OmpV family)
MRIPKILPRLLRAPRPAKRDRGRTEFHGVSVGAKQDTYSGPIAGPIAGLIPAIAVMLGLATAGARAEQLPLWEAGVGAAALSFPDYRGSNERQFWLLPFPYIVYRGEFLQADERRTRGLFYKTERLEIDISINGSVPVDSGKNEARQGMPNLDGTLEIGPGLNLKLMETGDRRTRMELRLPLRAVFASDFSYVRHVGWVFQPHVNVDIQDALGNAGWNVGLLAGPVFADQRYNRYFYSVEPAFATAARPAFSAGGGYGGVQMIAALSKRYREFWVGAFVKLDSLHGAAFADSPLVTDKQGVAAGFSIAWILGESKTRVEVVR